MSRFAGARVGASMTVLSMTVLMAILTAGHATAETIERAYAFGAVTVIRGGLPVAGVEDGLLLDQATDETCSAVRADPAAPAAVAAMPDAVVGLRIEVLGCRVAATPRAVCHWSIEPAPRVDRLCRASPPAATRGRGSWKDWEGDLTLRAPAATGLYQLAVSCRLKGAGVDDEQSLSVPFFVTYAEPLFALSPPEIDWYERACCWGAGFAADAPEADVLKALLTGLYRYGELYWHYGYSQRVEVGRYTFPLHETLGGQVEREYLIAGEALRPECFPDCAECCRCRWQGLVATATPCDFGDCYVFSDVFGAMAGVMGIGGLLPIEIDGAADQGFVTVPARSLDPRFPGNVTCPNSTSCPFSYYFGSHSLRLRDRLYYDATFDHTYLHPEEPIALNVDHLSPCHVADALTFLDSTTLMFTGKTGYGQWPYVSDPGAFCGLELKGVPPMSPVALPEVAVFEPANRDRGGIFESLIARLEVEVKVEGTYLFFAQLFNAERSEVVAFRPHWDSIHPTSGSVSGPPGHYPLELTFSGQQIYESGRNGPYWLHVHLGRGAKAAGWIESPPFKFARFGEQDVEVVDMGVPELDRSKPLPALPIDVDLTVRNAGVYALQARLAGNGVTISNTGRKVRLTPDDPRTTLDIPGAPIAASGLDGPYELTLEIYGPELTVIDARVLHVEGFDASSFVSEGGT